LCAHYVILSLSKDGACRSNGIEDSGVRRSWFDKLAVTMVRRSWFDKLTMTMVWR
jgi:hypothetical protein